VPCTTALPIVQPSNEHVFALAVAHRHVVELAKAFAAAFTCERDAPFVRGMSAAALFPTLANASAMATPSLLAAALAAADSALLCDLTTLASSVTSEAAGSSSCEHPADGSTARSDAKTSDVPARRYECECECECGLECECDAECMRMPVCPREHMASVG